MNALVVKTDTLQRMAVIAYRTNNLVVGAVKAMMIEALKERMQKEVVEILYTKADGSPRRAFATTMPSLAHKHTNGRGVAREMYATTAYFDVEAGAWRSFRWESLIKVF